MNEKLDLETIKAIEQIASNILYIQPAFAIIGILIIIPHLIITTRKSMRTSSTNSLIIGIALCDLIVLSEIIRYRAFPIDYTDRCRNPDTFLSQISFIFSYFCPETFTRSSFWSGLSLALIRLLVIKFPMNTRISELAKPSVGYLALILVLLLNFLPSANYYFRFEIIQLDDWTPPRKCRGFPANYSESAYLADMESEFQVQLYQVLSSTLQLTVSFTHPILAILLFFEIRRVAKKSSTISRNASSDKGRTSQMILLMTISFVISSLPVGVEIVFRESFEIHSIMAEILGYSTIFDTMLFAINGSVHCIICLIMSSEYRKTVKSLLRIREKEMMVWNLLTYHLFPRFTCPSESQSSDQRTFIDTGRSPPKNNFPPVYKPSLLPDSLNQFSFHSTMKLSSALAEIVSDFSGFQHLHVKPTSTSSESSVPRHSLNITVGVQQVDTITRSSSSNSLNDFQCIQRKTSTASYLVIE